MPFSFQKYHNGVSMKIPKFTECKPGSFLDKLYREKFGEVYLEFIEPEELPTACNGPEFEFDEEEAA